ncbi:prolyl oligopeptidase family serine peptidase [Chryseolinea sp. H1M3-3]|uniref:twin-arginine translocation signal domain-containing protein n=1 Tax=Chryseolinea sp. H1M3-3 TaxID=3034144 RepID=UPI0023EB06A8|nr:prolyl oligopeptidase family serine peptidase [Chryseolinea sp. H1M3-3]
MKSRREFMKLTGITGLGLAGGLSAGLGTSSTNNAQAASHLVGAKGAMADNTSSLLGAYGKWAASLTENKLPSLSFRNKEFTNVTSWKERARKQLSDRLAIPDLGALPVVKVNKQYSYDGLHIEELTWQLPYGPATDAIILKPLNAKGKLPGILAFHDHGGLKYFGTKKITRTADKLHPIIEDHQKRAYGNMAWANEVAKRGYVVLVSDTFPFASRRILLKDVQPVEWRGGLSDQDNDSPKYVEAYNDWAYNHEHVISKSLFSAGTTWPGVFFAEDKKALDILCNRPDVDANNIGCGGLSGGGMRTVFMAGQDDRIKCAVCVGFMTTWRDFVLNRAPNHTWMTYVPLLPNEMDFPEILGLRVPLPTLVMNDTNDELYTLDEMKRADKILEEVYVKAGAKDRYKCSFYPGPHKFDKEMQADAFDWFDRWLKN